MNYHECVRKWLRNNPGTVYDKNAFIEVFSKVNKKAARVENVVSSFCHSNIYPWDPQKVEHKKLAPAELFNKEDSMPNVNASVNEGLGDEENTHQEDDGDKQGSGPREVESEQARSAEKKLNPPAPVMGRIELSQP